MCFNNIPDNNIYMYNKNIYILIKAYKIEIACTYNTKQ